MPTGGTSPLKVQDLESRPWYIYSTQSPETDFSDFFLCCLWDLASSKKKERWRSHETYQMLHELNSSVLIGNNHHRTPFWGEDIQIFEKDAPGLGFRV